jgi:hypothetical protein
MRLFTVNFFFKGKTHSALVSFRQGHDLSFFVRYLDGDVKYLIPDGKIEVSLLEGLKAPKQLSKIGEDLVFQTTEAIAGYLHLQQE